MTYTARTKAVVALAFVVITGMGLYGANRVFAASPLTQGQSLAQRIAGAFSLNSGKVQAVISQYNADQQPSPAQVRQPTTAAQRLAQYETGLNQAVSKGQLTQAQADLILAEHNKLLSEYANAVQQTEPGPTLGAQLRQIHQAGVDWTGSNHIDSSWLFGPGA